MRKLMELMKFGSPKVNLILNKKEIVPGEKITGSIYLQGGLVKQTITRLECDLVQENEGKKPRVIEPVKTILMSRTISLNEKSEIPFHFRLTKELQPTSNDTSYRLRTKLVYRNDSQSTDHDEIVVRNYEGYRKTF